MRVRRSFQLLFALYVAGTLGVLVPAHHHAHGGFADAGHEHTHPLSREGHSHGHGHDHDHDPDQGPADPTHPAECSICLFARGLTAPPTEAPLLPATEVVHIRPKDAPSPVIHSSFVPTLFGRAPPAA
jgi:hypothetical protein